MEGCGHVDVGYLHGHVRDLPEPVVRAFDRVPGGCYFASYVPDDHVYKRDSHYLLQAMPSNANVAGLSIAWGICGHVFHLDCIQVGGVGRCRLQGPWRVQTVFSKLFLLRNSQKNAMFPSFRNRSYHIIPYHIFLHSAGLRHETFVPCATRSGSSLESRVSRAREWFVVVLFARLKTIVVPPSVV